MAHSDTNDAYNQGIQNASDRKMWDFFSFTATSAQFYGMCQT